MNDNISLKEVIQILLKGKLKIFLITVSFIALGTAYFFFAPKYYGAELTLLIKPITSNTNVNPDLNGIINNYAIQSDISTYGELIKNAGLMSETVEKLNLPMTRDELYNMITIEALKGTNLLKITVRNKDPQMAADIANSLGDGFVNFITEKNKEAAEIVSGAMEANMILEADKLDKESQRLKKYLADSGNIDLINGEIEMLTGRISEYKTSLLDTQKEIAIAENALKDIEGGIISANKLQDALLTIEATALRTQFMKNIEAEKAISEKISELESRLTELQIELANEKYIYNAIMRDYSLAEQTYGAYQTIYKESLVALASDVGTATIQISSEAAVPANAMGANGIVIISAAAMIGLAISIFATLFWQYWKTS